MNSHIQGFMKRFFKAHWFKAILLVSVVFLVVVVFMFFPKNITRLGVFGMLFIADYYIWRIFRGWFFQFQPKIKYLLVSLYWLPSYLLLFLMIGVAMFGYSVFVNTFSYAISGSVMMVFFVKFVMFVFVLISDTTRVATWLFRHLYVKKANNKIPRRSKLVTGIGLLGSGAVFVFFAWGAFSDVYRFKVEKVTITSPKLPASFDGLKILQISDIHFVSWVGNKHFKEAVALINHQKPDLVVFTGDLVTFRSSEAKEFIPFMREITAPYGVYSILGNHDYGDYIYWDSKEKKQENMEELFAMYKSAGWQLLRNETRYVKNKANDSIAIIGVENWSSNTRFPSKGDIKLAMKNVSDNGFRILLTHDPSHWREVKDKKTPIDLTVSGHTHGMQIAYIGKRYQSSPISLVQPYWAGLYQDTVRGREMSLYVNTGLGTVSYLSRVGVLPEITLITLKRKK